MSMKITVNARKVFVNQKLTEHIEKKLAKFDKFFPGEAEAQVKLSRIRDIERVEVTIQSDHTLFRAEDESDTFMNALDCCLYAIERQMRKNKTKLAKKLRENIKIPDYEPDEGIDVEDDGEAVTFIREKTFDMKPMSAEEAVLQMNLLGHQFFVYNDIDRDGVCVVYTRKSGGYGIIVPN